VKASFAIVRSGILDYLLRGEIGYPEFGIYVAIHLQADFSTGIWWGSAPRLASIAPRATTLREVQRWMQTLTKTRLIRPFHAQGARGNYPVLINKYDVKIGALKGKRLNAWRSDSWKNPAYEPCVETGALDDTEGSDVTIIERAPYQYSRTKRQNAVPTLGNAPSQDAITLALRLKQQIVRNIPTFKHTERMERKWARDADVMLRLDGRTTQQICELIDWCQQDRFWQTIILSMSKLREKFDQLTAKKNASAKGGRNHAEQRDIDNLKIAGFRVA
jgi:hypothetical protein